MIQICRSCACECVPSEGFTYPLGVSKARVGRCGWIPLFSGLGDHQSVAHGAAKPGVEMVGVAHLGTDPSRGVVVSSALGVLQNSLRCLVTVGYVRSPRNSQVKPLSATV
jgi:hypothetical protein